MRNQTWINAVALGVVVATISLILPACGGGGGGGGGAAGDTTRTTIGISGSLGVADVANDSGFTTRFVAGDSVDPESIHALVITITKIRMHHAGDGDDDGEEPPEESGTEEDGDGGSWIVVYDDPAGMDIDLKALDGTKIGRAHV